MQVLIGSRALNYWYPEVKIQEDTDWDIISYELLWDQGKDGYEWHDPQVLHSGVIALQCMSDCTVDYRGNQVHVMSPQGLKIIKRSHLWRDLKFSKHILHYQHLKDVKLDSYETYLLDLRTRATMQAHPQMHPNLNQSVEGFFDDAVEKEFSHDWLHELYAYENKPLYTKLQKDSSSAWCSADLWYNLSSLQKLQCISEEVHVIATERFLIPNNFKYPAKLAHLKALNKVCTTLCSGWFRDHAIDNYIQLLEMFNQKAISKVEKIINEERKRND